MESSELYDEALGVSKKKKLAYVRVEKQHGDKVSVRAEFRGFELNFQMSVGALSL